MTDHTAAMRQAREALENSVDYVWQDYHSHRAMWANLPTRAAQLDGLHQLAKDHDAALAALDAALAKVQEPVAWARRDELQDLQNCNYRRLGADSPHMWAPHTEAKPPPDWELIPLYTAPPAPAATVLTDEQLKIEWANHCGNIGGIFDFARAIEATIRASVKSPATPDHG